MFKHRNFQGLSLCAAQYHQLHDLIQGVQIHGSGQAWKSVNTPLVGGYHNVANLQSGGFGRTSRREVGNDDAIALGKPQPLGQSRSNVLRRGLDLDPVHVSVLAQALIDKTHHPRGNGKAQPFATPTLRQNHGVDAYDVPIHVHKRASAVSRVDGRIGLDIDHGAIGIRLPANRADNSHGDRILQPLRTAQRNYQLPLMNAAAVAQFERGQPFLIDLQQGQVGFFVDANDLRVEDVLSADRR